jgi:hypothetical protein
VYDHAGKRVRKGDTYYFYGIGGQLLVSLVCQEGQNGQHFLIER